MLTVMPNDSQEKDREEMNDQLENAGLEAGFDQNGKVVPKTRMNLPISYDITLALGLV